MWETLVSQIGTQNLVLLHGWLKSMGYLKQYYFLDWEIKISLKSCLIQVQLFKN